MKYYAAIIVLIAISSVPILGMEPGCQPATIPATQPASEPTTMPTTVPTTKPATAQASQPASGMATSARVPSVSPAVLKILKALEKAGKKYSTIRSDLDYEVVDRLTATSEQRTGWTAFQNHAGKKPSRFRIHFETLTSNGGRKIRSRVDYAFDGHWLTVAKHRIKQIIRFQVVPEGARAKPMRLGRGPFPLPFGQDVADVTEHFEITTRPVGKSGPKNTDYLKFVTRRRYRRQIEFRRLEMWIDRKTHLPVKMRTLDNNKKLTIVTFRNTRIDVKLRDSLFDIPRRAGWTERIERLKPARNQSRGR